MANIDTISASRPLLRGLAAFALVLCGACTTAEPGDADINVAHDEAARRSEVGSTDLDNAIAAWRASCDVPGLDGLCVVAVPPVPTTCERRLLPYVVAPRLPAAEDAGDVLDGLVGDLDQFTRAPSDPAEVATIGNAALARFDAKIEHYLTQPFNTMDDVGDWVHDGGQLLEGLAAMKRLGSPEMNVRAALRSAIVYAGGHDSLVGRPAVGPHAEHCAALAEFTTPLASGARATAQWCIEEAERKDYDGPLVDRCRELVAVFSEVQVPQPGSSDLRAPQ